MSSEESLHTPSIDVAATEFSNQNAVLLDGYFRLDTDKRELIYFDSVIKNASIEQVMVAHLAAQADKSSVVEWYYEGDSPITSLSVPIRKEYRGRYGYVDDVVVANTNACDIRSIRRFGAGSALLNNIFDVLAASISDDAARDRATSLFKLKVPLGHTLHDHFSLCFHATFWENGVFFISEERPKYLYLDLLANIDAYEGAYKFLENKLRVDDGAGPQEPGFQASP